MRAYLSIDIDYWQAGNFNPAFFDRLAATDLPIGVVVHHHDLVPHIRRHKFDTLVNLDYHSDVISREEMRLDCYERLNCANWVTHVAGAGRRFIWSYPEHACFRGKGLCHIRSVLNPFKVDALAHVGWKKILHRHRWFPRFCDLTAIGIAISPHWAGSKVTYAFLDWLQNNKERLCYMGRDVAKYLRDYDEIDFAYRGD